MSFIDSTFELWDDQALTTKEESRTNGNFFDMEEDGGTDAQLGYAFLNISIGTSEDGSCSSGGYFQLVTSDAVAFNTGSGAEQAIACIGSNDFPLFTADLAAGKKYSISVPRRILHRYVEIEWVPISQAAGAMTVDAWFGMEDIAHPMNIQKEPS